MTHLRNGGVYSQKLDRIADFQSIAEAFDHCEAWHGVQKLFEKTEGH